MITLLKAQKILMSRVRVRPGERRDLDAARGLVLARDIAALEDAPAFDRVFMDGYALRSEDVRRCPAILKVAGRSWAGEASLVRVRPGACVQVATGSVLPAGADAVVPVEATRPGARTTIIVERPVRPGDNFYRQGAEVRRGTRLLRKGDLLTPLRLALLASQGIRSVEVFRRPTVAILATGSELTGRKRLGQIRNATTPMLVTALRGLGFEPFLLGVVSDEARPLRRCLREGLKYDLLIVTGAVSVGEKDLVPRLLRACGARTLFHHVRIRPGKPVLAAARGRCLVFGLPGNPLSTWIGWLLFARPALMRMTGVVESGRWEEGCLTAGVRNRSGRLSFLPACLSKGRGRVLVRPLAWVGSADLAAAGPADAFFAVAADETYLAKGTRVAFLRTDL